MVRVCIRADNGNQNENATADWYPADLIPTVESHGSEPLIIKISFPLLTTGSNRSETLAAYG
jgi:hypothetical protein